MGLGWEMIFVQLWRPLFVLGRGLQVATYYVQPGFPRMRALDPPNDSIAVSYSLYLNRKTCQQNA
jgi:hypothetical protein